MLYDFNYFVHDSLGLHFWDLPALAVGIAMIVMAVIHIRNQRKRGKDFEEERAEKLEAMMAEACGENSPRADAANA